MHRLLILITLAASAVAGDVPRGNEAAPVAPDAASGGGATGPGGMAPQFLIILMIVAFMWFIIIRPQRKEDKRRKEIMASLKRGDRVVTIGGLHGEVVAVGEATVDLKAGEGDRDIVLRFNKGAVQGAPAVAADAKAT